MAIPDGMVFGDEDLREIIQELGASGGRWRQAAELAEFRAKHFHNDKSVDPPLGPQFADLTPFQSDLPRQIYVQLAARLNENHGVVKVNPPRDTARYRKPASLLEEQLNQAWELIEERLGISLQLGLAYGLIVKAAGVLHWEKWSDIYPAVPDPEELDEAKYGELDGDARQEYTAVYQDADEVGESDNAYRMDNAGKVTSRAVKVYRQLPALRDGEYGRTCAKAGWPFYVEFIDWENFACVADRSTANGLGIVLVRREMGLLRYARQINNDALSMRQANKDVLVDSEQDAPASWEPSRADWGDVVTIYQLWTRDEFYEVAVGNGHNWECVKAFKHVYNMPPFAIAPGNITQSHDPVYQYEPALAGIFRLKPAYDRYMTYGLAIAEQIALPYYYWQRVGTGEPYLEDGKPVYMSKNSALAMEAPEGYKLEKVPFELNEAFVQWGKFLAEEFNKAKPSTGQAAIESSTKPWTARLGQQQANVEPKTLLDNIRGAIQAMFRNMAYIMSLPPDQGGFSQPPTTFARLDKGGINRETTIQVDPKEIASLDIDVNIRAQSEAELITLEEHLREMLDDPYVPLTAEKFAELAGWEEPDERVADWRAESFVDKFVWPQITQQVAASLLGTRFVMGQNGQIIGPDGVPVNGAQIKQQVGMPSRASNQPPVQMNNMPSLQAPSTIPIQGAPA